jgi:hypothetical protein
MFSESSHVTFSSSSKSVNSLTKEELLALKDHEITTDFVNNLTVDTLDKYCLTDKRFYVFSRFIGDHIDTLVKNYSQVQYLLNEKNSFKKWRESIQQN